MCTENAFDEMNIHLPVDEVNSLILAQPGIYYLLARAKFMSAYSFLTFVCI